MTNLDLAFRIQVPKGAGMFLINDDPKTGRRAIILYLSTLQDKK